MICLFSPENVMDLGSGRNDRSRGPCAVPPSLELRVRQVDLGPARLPLRPVQFLRQCFAHTIVIATLERVLEPWVARTSEYLNLRLGRHISGHPFGTSQFVGLCMCHDV